jgi:phosphopantothenoylcysteine synthetase/decarboxylase
MRSLSEQQAHAYGRTTTNGLYGISGSSLAHTHSMQSTYKIGDPILHIELRRWADIVLLAPCSANTLSKIAHGVCDNLAVRPPPRV